MRAIKPKQTQYTPDLVKNVNIILVTATDVEFRAVIGQVKPTGDSDEFDQVSAKLQAVKGKERYSAQLILTLVSSKEEEIVKFVKE